MLGRVQDVREVIVRPHPRIAQPQGQRKRIHPRQSARMSEGDQEPGDGLESYRLVETHIPGDVWS